jgi:hypothetical protein
MLPTRTGGQVIEVANFTVFTVALFCDKAPYVVFQVLTAASMKMTSFLGYSVVYSR